MNSKHPILRDTAETHLKQLRGVQLLVMRGILKVNLSDHKTLCFQKTTFTKKG
jgi:hypothetical protein